MRSFSGNKDVDREILMRVDSDRDLLNACSTNKYALELCNEDFFRNRIFSKYPGTVLNKEKTTTWKNYYLFIVYYADKLLKEKNFVVSEKIINPKDYYFILKFIYHQIRLEVAANKGYVDLVQHLLSLHEVEEEDIDGIVSQATLGDNFSNALEIIKMLEDRIKDKQSLLNEALQNAAYKGNVKLIDYLISIGANDWNRGLKGAAFFGDRKLIDFFVKKGADDWNSALLFAARAGREDLVHDFVGKINVHPSPFWNDALKEAAFSGNKQLILYFISLGAYDMNRGMQGAAEADNLPLIKFFISMGADNWYLALNSAPRNSASSKFFQRKVDRI